ncbi:MAG: hypothetical protein L6Q67_24150, partial [Zoogloea sp.]|nr:hypothetical protein [Zoogloea sp.]
MSTSQKPKNKPFRAKTGKPGGPVRPGASGPRPQGAAAGQPQGGRRGRGRPEGDGNRAPRTERDDGFRQPKSNASAIGLSDLGVGRGNWRAKRQGNVGFGGGDDSYPLVSNELPPSAEGERRKK